MLPAERVIADEGLRVSADGVRLAVRLPWYRSLPLSTIEIESLSIGGAPVDLETVRFELDGATSSLAELKEQTDRFWFVLDCAWLLVPGLALPAGSQQQVALTINIYPPYIPGMKRSNPQTETLCVAQA